MKKKIKKWHKQALWSKEMVADAVKKGIISADEYKEITGDDYPVE